MLDELGLELLGRPSGQVDVYLLALLMRDELEWRQFDDTGAPVGVGRCQTRWPTPAGAGPDRRARLDARRTIPECPAFAVQLSARTYAAQTQAGSRFERSA